MVDESLSGIWKERTAIEFRLVSIADSTTSSQNDRPCRVGKISMYVHHT